ncbi:hypothetical protein [uncultured Photobacterium sp.]|uniref:hypothetical protein n=1 Tax=uncultured Photobacterium sp. TaxID=173973 RepID=UPI00263402F8|nr:hypothetical protein [uncultured Photobacterium sp.]
MYSSHTATIRNNSSSSNNYGIKNSNRINGSSAASQLHFSVSGNSTKRINGQTEVVVFFKHIGKYDSIAETTVFGSDYGVAHGKGTVIIR